MATQTASKTVAPRGPSRPPRKVERCFPFQGCDLAMSFRDSWLPGLVTSALQLLAGALIFRHELQSWVVRVNAACVRIYQRLRRRFDLFKSALTSSSSTVHRPQAVPERPLPGLPLPGLESTANAHWGSRVRANMAAMTFPTRLYGTSCDTMPSLQGPFVCGYWLRLDAAPPGGTYLKTMLAPPARQHSIYDGTSETGSPWD